MARSDYSHWNEDADAIWWQEEGRHETGEPTEEDFEAANDRYDDAYGDGLYDAENGNPRRENYSTSPKFQDAYDAGFVDGSHVPEDLPDERDREDVVLP